MSSLTHQDRQDTSVADRMTGTLAVALFGAVVVLNTASALFTLLSV